MFVAERLEAEFKTEAYEPAAFGISGFRIPDRFLKCSRLVVVDESRRRAFDHEPCAGNFPNVAPDLPLGRPGLGL
jgi:hypothetical protein